MRRTILFALAAVGAMTMCAESWTLDRCVEYAIEHNINIKQRQLSAQQGEIEVTAAKDRFLPEVSAYGSQNFNFGRGLTSENTYVNRNTSSFSVGGNLSLPIFQGLSAVRNLSYSRASLRALLEQVEAAKDDVTLNIISQYLQALYAGEMLQVARINLEISKNELARRRELLDAGKIPELDIFEAEAQVSSDELNVTGAESDSIMAVLELSQLLNLPSAEGFEIEPVSDYTPLLPAPEDVFANAWAINHTIEAGRLNKIAAEKNVSVAKAGWIPRLSFNAGIGTNYYKTSGFSNEGFSAQMRHNFAKTLGFSLSVPIFDAFSTRNSVKRANLQVESARLELDNARNELYKAIMQAHTQAVRAAKQQESSAKAVANTKAAFDAMAVKYNNGRANATEFEKAKSDYMTSLAQEVQARYEYLLRARIIMFYNGTKF